MDGSAHEAGSAPPQGKTFEVFYDGECPLCVREMDLLRRWDRAGQIAFTDIAEPTFDPTTIGSDLATLMARIHGRLPDGTLVEGVEVFRQLYETVGFKTWVRISRLPGIAGLADRAYTLFANNRLRLTGRCENGTCERPKTPQSPAAPSWTP